MKWRAGIWTLLTGVSVGWMIGLSQSPVIATVMAGIIPVVAAFIALAGGVPWKTDTSTQAPPKPRVPDVSAIAMLALGLAGGATVGMHYRMSLSKPTSPSAEGFRTREGLFGGNDGEISLPCTRVTRSMSTEEAIELMDSEPKPWPTISKFIRNRPTADHDALIALVLEVSDLCK